MRVRERVAQVRHVINECKHETLGHILRGAILVCFQEIYSQARNMCFLYVRNIQYHHHHHHYSSKMCITLSSTLNMHMMGTLVFTQGSLNVMSEHIRNFNFSLVKI